MSTDVRFYHLQRQRLEEALPLLVEKAFQAGLRLHIRLDNEETSNLLDKALWTYKNDSFLPHAKAGKGEADLQPIILSLTDENKNDATALLVVNASEFALGDEYRRCLYMFDGRDETIVAKAREDWKSLKTKGLEMSYWQQRDNGGWEQKA